MSLRDLTPEERIKLQQENPEEYNRLAGEDQPKPGTRRVFMNGRAVDIGPVNARYVNGRKVE
jgi:hypothetical protein